MQRNIFENLLNKETSKADKSLSLVKTQTRRKSMDTHNWSGFSFLDIYLFLSFQAETVTVLGVFNFVFTIPRTHRN